MRAQPNRTAPAECNIPGAAPALTAGVRQRLTQAASAQLLKRHPATTNRLHHFEKSVGALLDSATGAATLVERMGHHLEEYCRTHRAAMAREAHRD